MRKIVTVSMIAATSLFVAACGKTEQAPADNAVTEMAPAEGAEGTANDAMTNVDAAAGADANMAADANASAAAGDAAANAAGDAAANTAGNAAQ